VSLRIDKEISFRNIHIYYERLDRLIEQDATVDLIIPDRLTNYYAGISVAVFQFAATWLRYPKSGKLLIDLGNKKEINFNDLVEDELLFPILAMVWNEKPISDVEGKYNLRQTLKDPLNDVFLTMRKFKDLKGKKLFLFNRDHFHQKIGILKCFEIDDQFINDESRLARNLSGGIGEALDYSSHIKNEFEKISKSINEIIYVLMKYTHNWEKSDSENQVLLPNIRGLFIRFFKKP
ncbi:MAG: hypothetical protein RIF34_01285, partial [Candidatus Kapaibacterium sp.]